MDSGSISIPVNQRRYEKKLRDLKSHPGVADVYEPDQNSHGETDLIATPTANGLWNRTIWALLRAPGGGDLEVPSCFVVFWCWAAQVQPVATGEWEEYTSR